MNFPNRRVLLQKRRCCRRLGSHVSIVKWSVVMDRAWTGTVVMFYGLWWRWTDYYA